MSRAEFGDEKLAVSAGLAVQVTIWQVEVHGFRVVVFEEQDQLLAQSLLEIYYAYWYTVSVQNRLNQPSAALVLHIKATI